jgi:predicted HTH domain antitoxin
MSTVTLEIPEEFARSFGATAEEAARNARIELAIEMYREGKWSTGKAAEFAGLYIGKFMDLLRDRNVSRPYTQEMLEQDIRHAGRRL